MITLIGLLVLLQIKHVLADYVWQTLWEIENKGVWGHWGGIVHSAKHVALSSLVLCWFVPTTGMFMMLLATEFVLHYHIDWAKNQVLQRAGWTSSGPEYWWAMGTDQMLHQLCYLIMAGWALA